ncbi:MAG: TIGR01459 family HAD-type hydrolase [Pseudomonadota bacterium]
MSHNLEEIVGNYDALIVDLWGVIHDGSALYPGVGDTLSLLHALNKPVLFLSNAPRVAAKARKNLDALKIPPSRYVDIVTSGQVAHDMLAREKTARFYYYLGPGKDEDILSDVKHCVKVPEPRSADFILCTGYEFDGQPHEEIVPLLMQLLPLPMFCVNPDMEVVKQDGTQFLCAGAVAAEYTKLGGKVAYIGKPFAEVYAACRAVLGEGRILCVGDNPATDIKGANDAGMDCLLITGGVLSARYGASISEADARNICSIAGVNPTYVLSGFGMEPSA